MLYRAKLCKTSSIQELPWVAGSALQHSAPHSLQMLCAINHTCHTIPQYALTLWNLWNMMTRRDSTCARLSPGESAMVFHREGYGLPARQIHEGRCFLFQIPTTKILITWWKESCANVTSKPGFQLDSLIFDGKVWAVVCATDAAHHLHAIGDCLWSLQWNPWTPGMLEQICWSIFLVL